MNKKAGQPVNTMLAVVMQKGTPPLKKLWALHWPHAKRHLCCLDKCSGTTCGSTPLTWGQIKYLMDIAREVPRGQGQDEITDVLLLAMIAIISQQISPTGAPKLVHWAFVLHTPLLHAVTWKNPLISVLKNDSELVGATLVVILPLPLQFIILQGSLLLYPCTWPINPIVSPLCRLGKEPCC
jgi:hypothetical protein